MPENMSEERVEMIRGHGARLVLTPEADLAADLVGNGHSGTANTLNAGSHGRLSRDVGATPR